MATELELRERHRMFLAALLRLERENADKEVKNLQAEIDIAVVAMLDEDVVLVESIVGVKAR